MIEIIEVAIFIGLGLDLLFTYNFLGEYQKKFPKNDWTAVETNPLVRKLIRMKGRGEGIIISGTIIFFILLMLFYLINTNFKFFLAGCYYMMVTFHLTNLLALKRVKGGANGKKEK